MLAYNNCVNLFVVIRAKYPDCWNQLRAILAAIPHMTECQIDAITQWLRHTGIREKDGFEGISWLAVYSVLIFAGEIILPADRQTAMLARFRELTAYTNPRPARQIALSAEYRIELTMSGIGCPIHVYREQIIETFTKDLDAALNDYLHAAGIEEEEPTRAGPEWMELLASYYVGGRSIEDIAAERRQASDSYVRQALALAAADCGLLLRPRGRPVERKKNGRVKGARKTC